MRLTVQIRVYVSSLKRYILLFSNAKKTIDLTFESFISKINGRSVHVDLLYVDFLLDITSLDVPFHIFSIPSFLSPTKVTGSSINISESPLP